MSISLSGWTWCSQSSIGSDPLGEAMLPVLADARERFLRPAGVMIPARPLQIWTVGMEPPSIGHAEYLLEQKRRAAEELGDGYGVDLRAAARPLLASSL